MFASESSGDKYMRALIMCLLAAVLTSCSKEPEYTGEQSACIAKQYKNYDPKQLSQCVNVCKSCMKGNTATCNTSCKLNGAS
jgi:hypothetical protein